MLDAREGAEGLCDLGGVLEIVDAHEDVDVADLARRPGDEPSHRRLVSDVALFADDRMAGGGEPRDQRRGLGVERFGTAAGQRFCPLG